jgi:hypothetical protein
MRTDIHLSESVTISAHQWLKGLEQNRREHNRPRSIICISNHLLLRPRPDLRLYEIFQSIEVLLIRIGEELLQFFVFGGSLEHHSPG